MFRSICVFILFCLVFISVSSPSIADGDVENQSNQLSCESNSNSRPVDHFIYAVFCKIENNNGFETLWLPGGDEVSLTLDDRNDPETELLFRAFWIRASAPEARRVDPTSERFAEKIRDKRSEISNAKQRLASISDQEKEAARTQLEGLEDELREILLSLNNVLEEHEAKILRQDVENNNRVIVVSSPNPKRNLIENYDLLIVGTHTAEDAALSQAYITLANSKVSSKSVAQIVTFVIGAVLLIFFFDGVFQLIGAWRPFKGINGRLSLSSTQIALFSVITFTLSLYIFLRTGTLGDLSEDVLLLIGIVAGGSAAAKVTHRFTQRLNIDNWLWLKKSGWLKENEEYNWSQLFKDSKGEFDIFRFQAVMFSLLVASYLVAVGSVGLSTVDIPDGVMGILGLSQVTYISGKAVGGAQKWTDFGKLLDEIRAGTAVTMTGADAKAITPNERAKTLFEELFGYAPAQK